MDSSFPLIEGVFVKLIRRAVIMCLKSAPGMLRICESAGENLCWAIYLPVVGSPYGG